jgi:hypothetical protein
MIFRQIPVRQAFVRSSLLNSVNLRDLSGGLFLGWAKSDKNVTSALEICRAKINPALEQDFISRPGREMARRVLFFSPENGQNGPIYRGTVFF